MLFLCCIWGSQNLHGGAQFMIYSIASTNNTIYNNSKKIKSKIILSFQLVPIPESSPGGGLLDDRLLI